MSQKGLYPIRYVSRRTGLTPHVIRAWEKRYRAVVPIRTTKNRRLYSEDDVQRLQLLKRITDAGHTISQVANLETLELLDLEQREVSEASQGVVNVVSEIQELATGDYYQKCLTTVFNLDPIGLEQVYDQAAVDLTRLTLIKDLIVPLFEEIGNLWQSGALKIVNEHMTTSVTRTFLMNMLKSTIIPVTAPKIFIATTTGQWHELGALVVALTAAEYGWQPIYFGPNLPAEEIAAGVKQSSARAVALSITHLLDPYLLKDELYKLRKYVGQDVALFVGGSSAIDRLNILETVDATFIESIDQLSDELNTLIVTDVG